MIIAIYHCVHRLIEYNQPHIHTDRKFLHAPIENEHFMWQKSMSEREIERHQVVSINLFCFMLRLVF